MKRFLLTVFAFSFSFIAISQNFSGQWKGEFYDKSTQYMGWGGDKCEYVLDLETNGKKITGFSYTYFTEAGKRFYTICRLEGFIDPQKKYLEIIEVERTKTNVPSNINNCFQIHKLTYFKKTGEDETLEGNWIPAPNQKGNCGFGLTTLSRRALKNSFPGFKNSVVKTKPVPPANKTNNSLPNLADKNKTVVTQAKKAPVKPTPKKPSTPPASITMKEAHTKAPEPLKESTEKTISPKIIIAGTRFEKRNNTVLKIIEVANETIKVDLYDNGEVDGDSVSVFLNGKLMVDRKKLTTEPLTILIPLQDLQDENELVMYAENLGTIPPNTALMIVTDGNKRYEVRITSDLQKSGTIKFVKKK
jgi:hypothetical protein